jgi:hypothetical protein
MNAGKPAMKRDKDYFANGMNCNPFRSQHRHIATKSCTKLKKGKVFPREKQMKFTTDHDGA